MSTFTKLVRLLLLTFTILSLPMHAMADETPAVGTFKDWDDLDTVEIKQLFNLNDYATVTIEPFDTKEVELPEQDDNTFKPVVEARDAFSQRIFESVKDELDDKPVNTQLNKELGKVLVVRGKLIIMNPGVKSLRMFVGVGAGHAGVQMQCELVDQETNTVLATMTQKRLSSGGWLGGSYDGILEDLTEELGEDIASLIEHFN